MAATRKHRRVGLSLAAALMFAAAPTARGDERLAGIACRSVHLAYPAPAGRAFYNELTVDHSADGTYFMACGFRHGYFGIQELADGRKVVLFSVWDPGQQNDPAQVAAEQRVKLVYQGEGVRVGRFGNEGTGGQSFFDYDWKIGQTCRFLVTARVDGQRTEFAGWFYLAESRTWKHLVTFSTLTGGRPLEGYYSFVEDFRRNKVSTTKVRQAQFGNGWVQTTEGAWVPLAQARFTADANPATNINAGVAGGRFFLATGGDTSQSGAKLKETISREAGPGGAPPWLLELALEPPAVNTAPGPEYSDQRRDYAMVIGLERTPRGRLWAAWVAGGDSDKGYFVAASSDDDGASWSPPRLVIDPTEAPTGLRRRTLVGNFWTDPTGRLWLFFDQSLGYFDGRAGAWAITCDNPDDAAPVWSAPRRIWHGATLNKPIVLSTGEWLMPISLWTRDRIRPAELGEAFPELDELRMAHVFVSSDQGQTWTRRGGVVIPQTDFDEHMFVELADGRLWLLARTKYGLAETFSSDQGRTWAPPQPSAIQNPSARFFLRSLASGRLLLVKNGPLDRRIGRAELTAFLSADGGRSWQGGLVLDARTGVSYPDGCQAADGTLYVIYDRNRAADREILLARFREEDVLAGKLQSAGARLELLVSKAYGPQPAP